MIVRAYMYQGYRAVMSLKSRKVPQHCSKSSKLPLMSLIITIIMWLINMVKLTSFDVYHCTALQFYAGDITAKTEIS